MKKEERVLLLLLLNALIEYSVSGKSDIRRQGSGMVAELDVREKLRTWRNSKEFFQVRRTLLFVFISFEILF